MFKSDSIRELMALPRGPGPAFYKQLQLENRKIFNSNPAKQWL